jgi:sugar/nucleoside kinase (ribokinase family)
VQNRCGTPAIKEEKEQNMIDVVALGELLIDFTCQSVDAEGYPTMAAHPGGAPANFLAALSKFGAKAALLGKVGTDAFGSMLTTTLQQAGIETKGLIATDEVFTTLAFVTLDEHGDRAFSFARKPGADTCITFEELNLDLIDEAKVFHFGTLSLTDEPARTATQKAVLYAKSKGKLITYDPNLRKPLWNDLDEAKRQLLWGLQQADVVKISDEEVEFLFGMGVQEGAAHILQNYPVKLVFVTCGADGCWYQNAVAQGHVPSLSDIQVMDTTGAGDIFGGSAVWKLLQLGKAPEVLEQAELEEVVRFACTAAGLSTTRPGGISSVPEYNEVLKRM